MSSPAPLHLRSSALSVAVSRAAVVVLLLCVAACVSRVRAPVEERTPRPAPAATVPAPPPAPVAEPDWRPQSYTVKRGDTLYAIALDHGLDYRELAAWNNIENVNLIRVGQVLRLSAPGEPVPVGAAGVQTAPLKVVPPVVAGDARTVPPPPPVQPAVDSSSRNSESYKTQPKALKEPYSEQAMRDVARAAGAAAVAAPPPESPRPVATATAPSPPPESARPAAVASVEPKAPVAAADDDDKVEWVWPAKGKIVTGFSESASLKGIDIAGSAGNPVAASAAGKVVYAGTGLRGYGKLIIIKHNAAYLSAYAHNREILVKEGQQVAKGQRIAEMGSTDTDQVKLHFEIRRLGKPMDPLRYLPPA
jgi:lipoprotein NlpD